MPFLNNLMSKVWHTKKHQLTAMHICGFCDMNGTPPRRSAPRRYFGVSFIFIIKCGRLTFSVNYIFHWKRAHRAEPCERFSVSIHFVAGRILEVGVERLVVIINEEWSDTRKYGPAHQHPPTQTIFMAGNDPFDPKRF